MIALLLAAMAAQPQIDCDNAMTQTDMNICASLDYQAADKALNEQWTETAADMKRMDDQTAGHYPDKAPGYFDQLLAAQRAWLKYRDEHCASQGYLARGGTLQPMLIANCKTDLTKRRTEELRELTKWGN